MVRWIAPFLETHQIPYAIQPISPTSANLLAHFGPSFPPSLLFCTHLDTVTPYEPPQEEGDQIYGRGANDAKGALAGMLYSLLQNPPSIPVLLALTADEEGESSGVYALMNHPWMGSIRSAIVGEPCGDSAYPETFCRYPALWMGGMGRVAFRAKGPLEKLISPDSLVKRKKRNPPIPPLSNYF